MKQVIKVKLLDQQCMPKVNADGDWIDLRAADNIHLDCPWAKSRSRKGDESTRLVNISSTLIPLGVVMEIPKGMEAIVAPRSSTHKKFKILQSNSIGVIDQLYCGPEDQWFLPVTATENSTIKKGDRICQFRIQLSQNATVWQKIKWFFSNGVKLKVVSNISNPNRGGLGHSGVK